MLTFQFLLLHTDNVQCTFWELSIPFISAPKRFYRKTGILHNDGKFEITLDQRKLKSPKGNPLIVDSEPLALAVAAEWDAQKEKIQQSSMHLVCNQLYLRTNTCSQWCNTCRFRSTVIKRKFVGHE